MAKTIKIQNLTKEQHDLLCECVRYRCADNDAERMKAEENGLSSKFYDSLAERLKELKVLINY